MNVSLKNILEGEKILNDAELKVILIDGKNLKKEEGEVWIESEEYTNFLGNKSEVRLIKNKLTQKDALECFHRRQEFRNKMDLCNRLRLDKVEYLQLASYKNNILFHKGKKDTNVLGVNVGFLAVSYGLLAIVMPLLFDMFKLNVPESIINIYRHLVIISVIFVILVIKNMVKRANTQYGHNNILLDYQLKMVEEELERRKNQKLEVQQLSSRQFNRSSNNKEIRHNRKTRGKR